MRDDTRGESAREGITRTAYTQITMRSSSVAEESWLAALISRWGEECVRDAVLFEGTKGTHGLLSRVSKRCEQTGSTQARRPTVILEGAALLAVVRGEAAAQRPFAYDTRGLTPGEYREVEGWALR